MLAAQPDRDLPGEQRMTAAELTLSMAGQGVIVTGAASGIGRRTAELFAGAGAVVTACDIAAVDPRTPDGTLRVVSGDLTDEDSVRAAVETADSNSPLRALVHCAGIFDGPTGNRISRSGTASSPPT